MDLAVLKTKLGDDYVALESYVADLTGQRDAARKESEQGRKALKARVETLETLKTRLFDRLGLADEADIDALPDAKGQAEAVKQFEARVKRLEKELTDKTKALDETSGRYRDTRMTAEMQKALAGQPWIDQELVESYLRAKLDWQDDQIIYRHGETPVPLAEGVKLLVKDKPNLLKIAAPNGSGWSPSSGAPAQPNAETLSRQLFAQVAGKQPPPSAGTAGA